MKKKPLLEELVLKGKPLAEAVVVPIDTQQKTEICYVLDNLAADISAAIVPSYFQFSLPTIYYEIRLDATKEALLREFGWKISRIKIYDTQQDNEQYPDVYAWEEENKPMFYPKSLEGRIKKMGLTQPGSNDNGKLDDILYQ